MLNPNTLTKTVNQEAITRVTSSMARNTGLEDFITKMEDITKGNGSSIR